MKHLKSMIGGDKIFLMATKLLKLVANVAVMLSL